MCRPCKEEMDAKSNLNGPRMPYRIDTVKEWHCPHCGDGWSLLQCADFFGARARHRIMTGEGLFDGH